MTAVEKSPKYLYSKNDTKVSIGVLNCQRTKYKMNFSIIAIYTT